MRAHYDVDILLRGHVTDGRLKLLQERLHQLHLPLRQLLFSVLRRLLKLHLLLAEFLLPTGPNRVREKRLLALIRLQSLLELLLLLLKLLLLLLRCLLKLLLYPLHLRHIRQDQLLIGVANLLCLCGGRPEGGTEECKE